MQPQRKDRRYANQTSFYRYHWITSIVDTIPWQDKIAWISRIENYHLRIILEWFWREWSLILKVNSPILPSCWGFSFALGHGLSLQSHFSAMQPPFQCLPSCWGFSDLGHRVSPHSHSSAVQLLLLYWLCQSLWLCGSQQTMENS